LNPFFLKTPTYPLIFLFGAILLTICNTALLRIGRFRSKEFLRSSQILLLFFHPILKTNLPKQEWENLYFSISLSRSFYLIAYGVFACFYASPYLFSSNKVWFPLITGIFIFTLPMILDILACWAASIWSRFTLKIAAPLSLIFLLPLLPISGLFFYVTRSLTRRATPENNYVPTNKIHLREMIRESELHHHLEPGDQKLISSFINFKERVAKEIMVPRVDLFSLSAATSIREATRLFSQEGYSRIPIYRDTLDQIVGVVLYKDLLKCYVSEDQSFDAPLETIAKPVLYAPENKKVAHLFQDFRNKQIHMAIIVDEYGGTEGIVTIEDILEELVGEIEDEYDIDEEHPFWEIPGGGWIIDAKMTLLDIAEQLNVHIPTNPDYETLGGYIYHCAGTIPSKGWRISHDAFDLEVVSSNERAIKKIKIQPRI